MIIRFHIRFILAIYVLVNCLPIFAKEAPEEAISISEMARAFSKLDAENHNVFWGKCKSQVFAEIEAGIVKVIRSYDPSIEPGGGIVRGLNEILVSHESSPIELARTICHERIHLTDIHSLHEMGARWANFVDDGRVSIDKLHSKGDQLSASDPQKALLFSAFLFCTEYRAYKYTRPSLYPKNKDIMANIIHTLYLGKLGISFNKKDLGFLQRSCEESKSLEDFLRSMNHRELQESFIQHNGFSNPNIQLQVYTRQDSLPQTTYTVE